MTSSTTTISIAATTTVVVVHEKCHRSLGQDEFPYKVDQTDITHDSERDATAARNDVEDDTACERLRVRHGQGGDLDAVREVGVVQSGDGVGVHGVSGAVGVLHGDTGCERSRRSRRGG